MKLPLTHEQLAALAHLRRDLPAVRFVLIGAAALGTHLVNMRRTEDIDLVVVTSPGDLERHLATLGWERDKTLQQRWRDPNGVIADILPADAETIARGKVKFDGDTKEMNVVGFDLALRYTIEAPLDIDDLFVEVACLPVIAALKMISWLDRPHERAKDLEDIVLILKGALPEDDLRRWDETHPMWDHELEHGDQSAFFVGYEIAQIAQPSHYRFIDEFMKLFANPESPHFLKMLSAVRFDDDRQEEVLLARLRAFEKGLRFGPASPKAPPPRS